MKTGPKSSKTTIFSPFSIERDHLGRLGVRVALNHSTKLFKGKIYRGVQGSDGLKRKNDMIRELAKDDVWMQAGEHRHRLDKVVGKEQNGDQVSRSMEKKKERGEGGGIGFNQYFLRKEYGMVFLENGNRVRKKYPTKKEPMILPRSTLKAKSFHAFSQPDLLLPNPSFRDFKNDNLSSILTNRKKVTVRLPQLSSSVIKPHKIKSTNLTLQESPRNSIPGLHIDKEKRKQDLLDAEIFAAAKHSKRVKKEIKATLEHAYRLSQKIAKLDAPKARNDIAAKYREYGVSRRILDKLLTEDEY